MESVLSKIQELLNGSARPIVVTMSGPSGSGKTTILEEFRRRYDTDCTTISTDDYYIGKTRMRLTMPSGHTTNFDHPAAIDTARLARDLSRLLIGQPIRKPLYDMATSQPTGTHERVAPSKLIIVEGIAANLPQIRDLSDLSLALHAPIDQRLMRRIKRDTTRKGYTPEQTLATFMNHVEPSYRTYYAAHDARVDYTIDTSQGNSR